MHAQLMRLSDYSPSAWLLTELYLGLMAILLYYCTPWRSVTTVLDVLWYTSTAYLSYRIVLHGAILRQISRSRAPAYSSHVLPLQTGWPHPWVDRLLFLVIGPGVTEPRTVQCTPHSACRTVHAALCMASPRTLPLACIVCTHQPVHWESRR